MSGLAKGQSPQGGAASPGSMMTIIGELIQRAGGMQGLISLLQQQGLGGAVQSWVGTGSNAVFTPALQPSG